MRGSILAKRPKDLLLGIVTWHQGEKVQHLQLITMVGLFPLKMALFQPKNLPKLQLSKASLSHVSFHV